MYEIAKLQNTSEWSGEEPTIQIKLGDEGWKEAYTNWLKGKNPTNDKAWKKGVVACTQINPRKLAEHKKKIVELEKQRAQMTRHYKLLKCSAVVAQNLKHPSPRTK